MKKKDIERGLRSWEEGLSRLGECIVEFQRIEDVMGMCVAKLMGSTRRVGEIVTSEMSFRARISVYGALLLHRLKKQSLPDDLAELVKRLHWAEEQRNMLVHSLWDASESEPSTIHRSKKAIRKKLFGVTEEHFTPENLVELHELFEGIVTDLVYLTSEHLP